MEELIEKIDSDILVFMDKVVQLEKKCREELKKTDILELHQLVGAVTGMQHVLSLVKKSTD